jgi:cyclopropane fatty-acyl-phospholipid synthase-like methyltransferase
MRAADFATSYDAILREPRMRRLYGDSGYFNVGYWTDGIAGLPAACDRMVDEIAAALPPDVRTLLDVGCGLGAGTMRLARRFPDARVIGGNLSSWQLSHARRRGVRDTVALDAARLPFADGVLDAVVAIESPQHFDTREKFLREAHRVLKPGGRIALADMLFEEREAIGGWLLPPENRVSGLAGYTAAMAAAGFEDVAVRDIAEQSWRPFCALMRTLFPDHADSVAAYERSLSHYVLASGAKPVTEPGDALR